MRHVAWRIDTTVQRCFKHFSSGAMSSQEKEGRGRPSQVDLYFIKAVSQRKLSDNGSQL